ncbi:Fur family transcriptional regulator [Parvicella tangerina]|uniref:Transcriptional repressor n=1 Tax=Parvicella tangerina TaxID=2829795 RepID=A0A916JLA6_9FLAO|nr:transcriptional repressor [Parvicella tangerina]CAG5080535.1 hypothetical protein CRYO30217_01362 [Parvicella tangerina]
MIEELLKSKGVRKTAFRAEVLELFASSNAAVDMESIEAHLGKFDRITLYRTMKTFLEKGLIHEINIGGEKKYGLCDHECGEDHTHHHDHVHFHCEDCKEVFCLEISAFPDLEIPGYEIEEMEIQLKGICERCKKKLR